MLSDITIIIESSEMYLWTKTLEYILISSTSELGNKMITEKIK